MSRPHHVIRSQMERLKMLWRRWSNCSPSAESLGSLSSLLSWIRETHRLKDWVPVQHRDFSVVDVRPSYPSLDHYCSLITRQRKIDKLSTDKSSVSSITTIDMLSSWSPLQQEKRCECVYLGRRVGVKVSARGYIGPRSYGVKVGESTFVRNRRQLIRSDEQPMPSPL